MSRRRTLRSRRRGTRPVVIEWPTIWLAATIYGGWAALTLFQAHLPIAGIVVAGGWLVAWQGSLQHETIHGHPTCWAWLNTAIGFTPLSLWLPYAMYRRSHIAHHASERITHPSYDPESRYLSRDTGVRASLARAQATLVGRLVIGPFACLATLAREEIGRVRQSPGAVVRDWLPHLVAVGLIAGWLEWTGFGVGRYLLLVVYPGTALTLLRSFAEHHADLPHPARAATVERGGLLGILFLNNHFHDAHHERPGLAWYKLPASQRHRRRRGIGVAHYRSYGEIVRRFAFRSHHVLVHPAEGATP